MKRHEPSHEDVQRTIDEQEQAMAELLTRIMALPLAPLHKTIATLQTQFTNAQREGANVILQMQTSLDAMRQRQDTQMNRLVEIATDARSASEGLENLNELLTERHDAQAVRDQHVEDQLAGLHTKAVAAAQSTAQVVAKIAAEFRTQLKAQSADHGDRLAAATHAFTRIDTGLDELRTRIDAVAPALAALLDTLAATVQDASRDSARHYHSLSKSQKSVVAATVQEQLAPFQAKTRFLLAFSALSCTSTVALLCMHFIH